MTAILDIRNLSLSRGGKPVLHELSLSVGKGEISALLGANGAGKSSLVLGAAGMIPLSSGSVEMEGEDLVGRQADSIRASGLAAVPEGHHVLAGLTVQENLEVAGATQPPVSAAEGIERAYAVFPELADRTGQLAGSLSGGQQQMVVLAQAIVSKPKVILVDEMSLGLAPLIVKRLLDVIRDLAANGVGVLLIEQFTHLALGLADHVYVMDRGHLVFSGSPAEVEDNPDILREAYLAGG